MDIQEIRKQFPITSKCAYLNHAEFGPISLPVQAAMAEQTALQMAYLNGFHNKIQDRYRAGRFMAAQIVNGSADRVSYIQNTAHGMSLLVNGIRWEAGDNVIVPSREYPSNYLPWKMLQARGVELRHIEMEAGRLTADGLARLIDSKTKVVALSHVQFVNGFRVDLAPMAELCKANDALLVVDGSLSVGGMTFDMWMSGADALIVSAHKWMLGPSGIGFMVLSDQAFEKVHISNIGLKSVRDPFNYAGELEFFPDGRRFEPDVENGTGIFGLYARMEQIMSLSPRAIENRIGSLTDRLCQGLLSKGYRLASPRKRKEKSGIVTFGHANHPNEEIYKRLYNARIIAGRTGIGVQVSPHYYNTEDEIDHLLATLL